MRSRPAQAGLYLIGAQAPFFQDLLPQPIIELVKNIKTGA